MAVYNSYWKEIKSPSFKSLIYNRLSRNQIKSNQMWFRVRSKMNRFIKCREIFTASCFIKNWERKIILHGRYSVILGAVPLSKCWLSAGVLHYVTKSWQTAYVLMCLWETSNKYWTEAAKTKIIYSSSNIDNHFDKHFFRQATISYPESSGLLFSGWAPG